MVSVTYHKIFMKFGAVLPGLKILQTPQPFCKNLGSQISLSLSLSYRWPPRPRTFFPEPRWPRRRSRASAWTRAAHLSSGLAPHANEPPLPPYNPASPPRLSPLFPFARFELPSRPPTSPIRSPPSRPLRRGSPTRDSVTARHRHQGPHPLNQFGGSPTRELRARLLLQPRPPPPFPRLLLLRRLPRRLLPW